MSSTLCRFACVQRNHELPNRRGPIALNGADDVFIGSRGTWPAMSSGRPLSQNDSSTNGSLGPRPGCDPEGFIPSGSPNA